MRSSRRSCWPISAKNSILLGAFFAGGAASGAVSFFVLKVAGGYLVSNTVAGATGAYVVADLILKGCWGRRSRKDYYLLKNDPTEMLDSACLAALRTSIDTINANENQIGVSGSTPNLSEEVNIVWTMYSQYGQYHNDYPVLKDAMACIQNNFDLFPQEAKQAFSALAL